MEECINKLFCKSKLAKDIAKHVTITIIPQVILGGAVAGIQQANPSAFDGELEKYIIMTAFIILMVAHIISLIYYYRKLIERCRARRQVYSVDVQPVRMRPQERRPFINIQTVRMWSHERRQFDDEDNYVRILPNREVIYTP